MKKKLHSIPLVLLAASIAVFISCASTAEQADGQHDADDLNLAENPFPDRSATQAEPHVTAAVGAGDPDDFDGEVVVLEVAQNHPNASDSNPGSAEFPFKTISAAVNHAADLVENETFFVLKIHDGLYREDIVLTVPDNRGIRLLVEGVGNPVISGAEAYTGWIPAGNGFWEHDWKYDWGFFTEREEFKRRKANSDKKHLKWIGNSHPIFQRREIVVFNGDVLRQRLFEENLEPGEFHIDEARKKIVLMPPADESVEGALIEVGERNRALGLYDANNITLRNLTFKNTAGWFGEAVVQIRKSNNLLIENCHFEQGNHRGLALYGGRNITLRNCTANNNGAQGADISFINNLLIESCITNGNNWRGDWGDVRGWAIAGIKILNIIDGVVRDHESNNNFTRGIWWDIDNMHVTLENSRMNGNVLDGLMVEAGRGPVRVSNCEMKDNTKGGVWLLNTERVTIENCIIEGNHKFQIGFGTTYRRIKSRASGVEEMMRNIHISFFGNTIMSETADQYLIFSNTSPGKLGPFLNTLQSGDNTWVHPNPDEAFRVAGRNFGFDEWRNVSNGDAGSTMRTGLDD